MPAACSSSVKTRSSSPTTSPSSRAWWTPEDLPLNISRETLQENIVLRKISQTISKQILSHLEKMAKDDAEKYNSFWKLHGKVFKLGYSDFVNRDRITPLLRFNSSAMEDADGLTSLDDYISRARESQKEIWYVAARAAKPPRSTAQRSVPPQGPRSALPL